MLKSLLFKKDIPSIVEFLKDYYGADSYCVKEAYFKWAYLENACAWFKPYAMAERVPVGGILDDRGKIQTFISYIPYDAITPWGGTKGVWVQEWINQSQVKGLGRKLAGEMLEEVDIVTGYGSNPPAIRSFQAMGFSHVDGVSRTVIVLDGNALNAILKKAGSPELPRLENHKLDIAQTNIYKLKNCDQISPRLIDEYRQRTKFGAARNKEWMTWRYDQHPYIEYEIVALDENGEDGFAVVRVEKIIGTEHSACRVVDFFYSAGRAVGLLRAVLAFARKSNCCLLDYFVTSAAESKMFHDSARELTPHAYLNPAIPFKFQPLHYDQSEYSFRFIMGSGTGKLHPGAIHDFLATKSDSNQDVMRIVGASA